MVDFKKLADENRDKIEQGAEKAVEAGEQRTGTQAPSQVDERIDGIDPTDGDGGGEATDDGPDDSRDRERADEATRDEE